MSAAEDPNAAATPSDERRQIEALVSDCIEALERGEPDPCARICAAAPHLESQVQRRLAQLRARGLLPTTHGAIPATIGPYRIVRELGSGGMGAVYLAEQQAPVQRQVALKVIKLGMDTREVVARFQAERQALALMNHPHIAQVFDAGATGDGRPYFAMEFVEGEPITAFCDARRLPVPSRLDLFAAVCRAMQHAHDKGVIHRDLKPGNVLVAEHEGQFVPKVIDFGIAKATGGSAAAQTRTDQLLGTPEYMSPEQAVSGGLDVDTRTDVYSLGALLYELLCGELPFDSRRLRHASRSEMERILLEEPPAAPSTRLHAAPAGVVEARGAARTSVLRRVAGELDWIVLKALRKQRAERYASPLAFAEDVERWLRHEPVDAAPPRTSYRLRKFVRRHRVLLGSTAAVFGALVVALAVSLEATGSARAAQQKESEALADTRVFFRLARDAVFDLRTVAGDLAEVPRAESVRRRLLDEALRFYHSLSARSPRDPDLLLDIANAQLQVGVLQGELGRIEEQVTTLSSCVGMLTALRATDPQRAGVVRQLAAARSHLARGLSTIGRKAEARSALGAALEDLAALRDVGAADVAAGVEEAGILVTLARGCDDDTGQALAYADRAVARLEQPCATPDAKVAWRIQLAYCHTMRGQLLTQLGQVADAGDALARAVSILDPLSADGADVAARRQLARTLGIAAPVFQRLDRLPEAVRARERAVALFARLAADHPEVPSYADEQAGGLHDLADMAKNAGELDRALRLQGEAVAIRTRVVAEYPERLDYRLLLMRSRLNQVGTMFEAHRRQGGRFDDVVEAAERALGEAEALHASHPDDPAVGVVAATVHEARAVVHSVAGRPQEAAAARERARRVLDPIARSSPKDVEVREQLALLCMNLAVGHLEGGDPVAAAAAAEEGFRHARAGVALDARHPDLRDKLARVAFLLGIARRQGGDPQGALAVAQELLAIPDLDEQGLENAAALVHQQLDDLPDGEAGERLLAAAARGMRAGMARRDIARGPPTEQLVHEWSVFAGCLADVLIRAGRHEEAWQAMEHAAAVLRQLTTVPAASIRQTWKLLGDTRLQHGDIAGADAAAEELATRLPEDGEARALAAVLLCSAVEAGGDAAESRARRAVAHLGSALQHGFAFTVDPRLDREFAALHDREDFRRLWQ